MNTVQYEHCAIWTLCRKPFSQCSQFKIFNFIHFIKCNVRFLSFIIWINAWDFSVIFLSCKANARVKFAKTGHGLQSSKFVLICIVMLLFVLFCVLLVCKWVLYYCHRVADHLQLTNISYIISYHIISYHIISYHIISYHIISYHIISYHIIPYHTISYHIISYHI